MNIVSIICPRCSAHFKLKFAMPPKWVSCPKCKCQFKMPSDAASEPAAPVTAATTHSDIAEKSVNNIPEDAHDIAISKEITFLMGKLSNSSSTAYKRGLVVFDIEKCTVHLAEFIEIAANDALKSSPIKHNLTMLWEGKGRQIGHRTGDKIFVVGTSEAAAPGWAVGEALGGAAQAFLTGDQPEIIIRKIRDLKPDDAVLLIAHILSALKHVSFSSSRSQAFNYVKSYSFSDIIISADAELGFKIFFGRNEYLTFKPDDHKYIPTGINVMNSESKRYTEELQKLNKDTERQQLINIAVIGGMIIAFIIVLILVSNSN